MFSFIAVPVRTVICTEIWNWWTCSGLGN